LRTEPSARSAELGSYEAGTEIAILGTAAGGDYFYVSPCNACGNGFAPRAALKIP
jgi:hypothetical protein